jgi:hypothetical protein
MSSSSRAASSNAPSTGRRRSNTATSFASIPPPPPVPSVPARIGDQRTLSAWVHDPGQAAGVLLSRAAWYAGGGSVIRAVRRSEDGEEEEEGEDFLFVVPAEETPAHVKFGLQVRPCPWSAWDSTHLSTRDRSPFPNPSPTSITFARVTISF